MIVQVASNSGRLRIFATRATWLTGGVLLQLWQFRVLDASEFVYISVASLAAGIISQFDLGFSNLFVSTHLEDSNRTRNPKEELQILFNGLRNHQTSLRLLFIFWTLLSTLFALWPIILAQSLYSMERNAYLISIVGLSLNAVSVFLSKLISTLGQRIELQVLQLCTIVIQIILFAIYKNFTIAIINLLVFPILIIAYWKYLGSKATDNAALHSGNGERSFMLNFKLQFSQIIGLTITLITPFIAIFYLNAESAAVIQLLIKFSAVLVTLGSAFYLTVQRDSYKMDLKEYFSQIRSAMVISLLLSTSLFSIIHVFGLLESLGAEQPNYISYLSFVVFVTLQPLNISLYFLVMKTRGYGTLLISGLSNLTTLITLALGLISHVGINAVYPSILLANVASAIPIILKLRAINFFEFPREDISE